MEGQGTRVPPRPRIAEFYSGRHVLVTGATGFMGKVLVEKLVRSCPGLGGVFVLMRPKRGKDVQDRVKELLQSPLFSVVEDKYPGLVGRLVVAVSGDVSLPGLGLSPADRALLQDKVSVVFHGAATVRFDEPLQSAITINLRGTRELAELAVGMKKLKAFVHVSTTYCNTDRDVIDEKLYPPHADWAKMIAAMETQDSRELDFITGKLLDRLPNTYTFTKSLGEHCVYSYRDKIPLVIFRPSIVISSLSEPVPGWVDNFHGPVALMVASGKGLVHITLADSEAVADYMPVDIAIKALIVAAWERATSGRPAGRPPALEPPVYNCSSAAVKPVTMAQMVEMGKPLTAETPFDNVLWPPYAFTTTSRTVLLLVTLLLHMIPAFFIDAALVLTGRRPRLWRMQRRIYSAQDTLGPFMTRSWTFRNANMLALDTVILPEDADDFRFDFRDVDVLSFFRNVTIGGRRYLLKERDEDLPKARAHYARMAKIEKTVRFLLLSLALFWALRCRLYLWPVNVISFLLAP